VTGARQVDSLAHTPGLLPLLTAAGQHRLLAKILPKVSTPSTPPFLFSITQALPSHRKTLHVHVECVSV